MTDTKKYIDDILIDLYALDPSFRDHDAELRKLIEKLILVRPEVVMDETFRAHLKLALVERAQQLSHKTSSRSLFPFVFMNKFIVLGGGAVLSLVVLVAIFAFQGGNIVPSPDGNVAAIQITQVGGNAFGSLSSLQNSSGDKAVGMGAAAPRSQSGGGFGGGGAMESSSGIAAPSPAMPYVPTRYSFVYNGNAVEIPDTIDVLKKIKGGVAGGSSVSQLSQLVGGLIEPSSLNGSLDSFTIIDSNDFGYVTTVSLTEGTVSMYQNWQTWPAAKRCAFGCPEGPYPPIAPSDILSDDRIIGIANDFLVSRGISRANYGEPVVNKWWSWQVGVAGSESMPLYVEDVQVIYPLVVSNNTVYGEDGRPTGLQVSVNIREKRASGMSDLSLQRYESSAYEAEKEISKILSYANSRYYWGGPDENIKDVKIEMGEPRTGYVRTWVYSGIETKELLVPALIFPLIDAPREFGVDTFVVPLAKELLDQRMRDVGAPQPMPFDVKPLPSESEIPVSLQE